MSRGGSRVSQHNILSSALQQANQSSHDFFLLPTMKTSGIVAAAAILLQSQQVQASPITSLLARGKADIILAILKTFGVIFPDAEAETTW
jgi:hypothetical protein|tara:strand:+ start:5038 stop:5307 length:270 start_codon:yes stop_codon:yes gene_type:complete